ncbi:transglycosylase domain-containing protein, partial [Paenibacillus sp. MAHUQ-63]|nr:transglycosylase domain-containing protein [Paenibacillus sp. MAHUQ-63]
PKDYILAGYINTSYYGRNAYGIQAAAQAYYRKDAEKLSVAQGAYLAALLQRRSDREDAAQFAVRARLGAHRDRVHPGQRHQPVEHGLHGPGADRLLGRLAVVVAGDLDVRRRAADHPGLERELHAVGHGGQLRQRPVQRLRTGRRFGDLRVQRFVEREQSGAGRDTGMSPGPEI